MRTRTHLAAAALLLAAAVTFAANLPSALADKPILPSQGLHLVDIDVTATASVLTANFVAPTSHPVLAWKIQVVVHDTDSVFGIRPNVNGLDLEPEILNSGNALTAGQTFGFTYLVANKASVGVAPTQVDVTYDFYFATTTRATIKAFPQREGGL